MIHTNYTDNAFYKDGYIFADSIVTESESSIMLNYYDKNGNLIKSNIIDDISLIEVKTNDEYIYLEAYAYGGYHTFYKINENLEIEKEFFYREYTDISNIYFYDIFTIENKKINSLVYDPNDDNYKVFEIDLDLENYQLKEITKSEYPLLFFNIYLKNNDIDPEDITKVKDYYYVASNDTVCFENNRCYDYAILLKYNSDYELEWKKDYNKQYLSFTNIITTNDNIYLNISGGSSLNNNDDIGGIFRVSEDGQILDKVIPDSNVTGIATKNNILIASSGTFKKCVGSNNYETPDTCRSSINHKVFSLEYNINTKTDGNGEVKVSKNISPEGEGVTFEVIPKEGYVLSEVKVTDALGNIITFTDYKFTMPSSDVLIEAVFVPANPNTKDEILIAIVILLVSLIAVILIKYKEKKLS